MCPHLARQPLELLEASVSAPRKPLPTHRNPRLWTWKAKFRPKPPRPRERPVPIPGTPRRWLRQKQRARPVFTTKTEQREAKHAFPFHFATERSCSEIPAKTEGYAARGPGHSRLHAQRVRASTTYEAVHFCQPLSIYRDSRANSPNLPLSWASGKLWPRLATSKRRGTPELHVFWQQRGAT